MIVLTAEEAWRVRGRSPKDAGRALDPVPLRDGRFMLGEEVLDDPANGDVREFLAALPREDILSLPLYVAVDWVGEAIPDGALPTRIPSRWDEPKPIDEAQPDTLTAVDSDGEPRKPA